MTYSHVLTEENDQKDDIDIDSELGPGADDSEYEDDPIEDDELTGEEDESDEEDIINDADDEPDDEDIPLVDATENRR